jgi:hypothetical protein
VHLGGQLLHLGQQYAKLVHVGGHLLDLVANHPEQLHVALCVLGPESFKPELLPQP